MPLAAGISEASGNRGFSHPALSDCECELRLSHWPLRSFKLHRSCALRSRHLEPERLVSEDVLAKESQVLSANERRTWVFSCKDVRIWESALHEFQRGCILLHTFVATFATSSAGYDTIQHHFLDLCTQVVFQQASSSRSFFERKHFCAADHHQFRLL